MVRIIMHGCNGHMGQVITGIVKEDKDATFSSITILYTAYLCANIEQDDNTLMTKEEFMENIPQSFVLINNLANELANPKQKKISGAPLPKQQRR